jgi:hypothetical protein
VDNDLRRSFPPPVADDLVDDDLEVGTADQSPGSGRSERFRFAPPRADQRVELTRPYLPWAVLATLLGLAVAVYFLL